MCFQLSWEWSSGRVTTSLTEILHWHVLLCFLSPSKWSHELIRHVIVKLSVDLHEGCNNLSSPPAGRILASCFWHCEQKDLSTPKVNCLSNVQFPPLENCNGRIQPKPTDQILRFFLGQGIYRVPSLIFLQLLRTCFSIRQKWWQLTYLWSSVDECDDISLKGRFNSALKFLKFKWIRDERQPSVPELIYELPLHGTAQGFRLCVRPSVRMMIKLGWVFSNRVSSSEVRGGDGGSKQSARALACLLFISKPSSRASKTFLSEAEECVLSSCVCARWIIELYEV